MKISRRSLYSRTSGLQVVAKAGCIRCKGGARVAPVLDSIGQIHGWESPYCK